MCLFEGCYPDSIKSLPKVFEMTMTISSVEMCQEICHHENIRRFAVKVDIRYARETVFFVSIRFDLHKYDSLFLFFVDE